MGANAITVFTKAWKCSIPALGEILASLGVDGLELPVRPGFPVSPDNMQEELPKAVTALQRFGLKIYSIAGSVDEATVAACGAAGVPIIRTMMRVDVKKGYRRSVDEQREQYERLIPALDKHGVTIGVQNHCDNFVTSAIGLVHAIGDFAPKHVGAVLDVAHCGLSGEPEAIAIDIAWPHLIMVNLKNGFRMRLNGPEAAQARWRTWWTTGRHGFASWPKTAAALQERGYTGPLCLSAEYTNPEGGDVVEDAVLPMIREDVELARSLFG